MPPVASNRLAPARLATNPLQRPVRKVRVCELAANINYGLCKIALDEHLKGRTMNVKKQRMVSSALVEPTIELLSSLPPRRLKPKVQVVVDANGNAAEINPNQHVQPPSRDDANRTKVLVDRLNASKTALVSEQKVSSELRRRKKIQRLQEPLVMRSQYASYYRRVPAALDNHPRIHPSVPPPLARSPPPPPLPPTRWVLRPQIWKPYQRPVLAPPAPAPVELAHVPFIPHIPSNTPNNIFQASSEAPAVAPAASQETATTKIAGAPFEFTFQLPESYANAGPSAAYIANCKAYLAEAEVQKQKTLKRIREQMSKERSRNGQNPPRPA
ncbi:hypothetical protein CC85DRAFT_330457 [Cutaneotrichosporon oleaginosum]|uniref:Uncharacterized protein n=1 Tax=Cutaneotrichosporon oleaginosum TaxID=879819 RepID=A0A0J1AWV2_9TREE|nr:uncharacterized protein CC85DRAFT_330457 [Cutaneotrichosporon oleaginosum]KLT39774.1 hypothetical protein CC85DRAFT_330457 [Cutaneotrichosporon oleaginosum]TXT05680.1 hypothetical protein COLE_07000 [Cutaneotrichosporon oleaginosum]